jgi:hypothetical protein
MTNCCIAYPCQKTASGHCPVCNPPIYTLPPAPTYASYSLPQGCICPPTSEQTCQNPACPRKDHSKFTIRASGPRKEVRYDVGVLVRLVSAGLSDHLKGYISRTARVLTIPDNRGLFLIEFEYDRRTAAVSEDMVERAI